MPNIKSVSFIKPSIGKKNPKCASSGFTDFRARTFDLWKCTLIHVGEKIFQKTEKNTVCEYVFFKNAVSFATAGDVIAKTADGLRPCPHEYIFILK